MPTTAARRTTHASRSRSPLPIARRFDRPVPAPVRDGLWRVVSSDGTILGHVERIAEARGDRFQARRLVAGMPSATIVGEFWTLDAGLECFRAA